MTKPNREPKNTEQPSAQFEHWQKFQTLYGFMLLAFWLLLHAMLNTTTQIMERSTLSFWEPLCWELTSALAVFLLSFALSQCIARWPRYWKLHWQGLLHLALLLTFSMAHITLMVLLREVWYAAMGSDYEFGSWRIGLLYELRKDAMTYITLVIAIVAYRFIFRRLQGEASLLNASSTEEAYLPDKLLIKKLGKEFLVNMPAIEWIEAAGNYAVLHVGSEIFPMRATIKKLSAELPENFIRIHRSTIVNINGVAEITPMPGGDYEVRMTTGVQLTLSRRYREEFKSAFSFSG